MIRIIFIVVAFLMMMGAVVGGLYYWGIDPLEKLGLTIGKPRPIDASAETGPAAPVYVDFGLLIVPVVRDREVRNQAELILRLAVTPDNKERVAANLPRLQNAYLQEMMSFLPVHLREGQRLNPDAVRRRLLKAGEGVVGPGMINDIVVEHAAVK